MKLIPTIVYGLCLAASIALAQAQENKEEKPQRSQRRQLTAEQKKIRDEIQGKYDANKNGRLDAEERKKISKEDRERLKKAGLGPNARRARAGEKSPERREGVISRQPD
jgi:hypothetical protein